MNWNPVPRAAVEAIRLLRLSDVEEVVAVALVQPLPRPHLATRSKEAPRAASLQPPGDYQTPGVSHWLPTMAVIPRAPPLWPAIQPSALRL